MRKIKKRPALHQLTKKMRLKLVLLFMLMVLALFGLNVRMSYINMKSGEQYSKKVLDQKRYESRTLPYQRGSITDRNGNVLANSTKIYRMILDPKLILSDASGKYLSTTLQALNGFYGYDMQALQSAIHADPESQYLIWETDMTYEEMMPLQSLMEGSEDLELPEWFPTEQYKTENIRGVWFEEDYVRQYPNNFLASDVIGFANGEGTGSYGIEQYYNNELSGTNGRIYGYLDENTDLQTVVKPAIHGNTIVSTIDITLQKAIESRISEFMNTYGAENVGVLLLDPNNGEILSMASAPTFDLNDPDSLTNKYSEQTIAAMSQEEQWNARYELWKNFCISYNFEPGSTAKPLTVAASLNEGLTYDGEVFYCGGSLDVGGDYPIRCDNHPGIEMISLEQSIVYSCNVAMMDLGLRMGKEQFLDYQSVFNLGYRTGIDLPGEEAGLVMTLDNYNQDLTALPTNAFGQNFNVNMVQMASAFASLINGGYYYQPHIMKKVVDSYGGVVSNYETVLVKNTISNRTSLWLKEYLYQTVENGTGVRSKVDGFSIGGKTGTAEKQPRDSGKYVVSFISFAPVEDPQVLLYVVIDEPHVEEASAALATEMSGKIYRDILPKLGIYSTEEQPSEIETSEGTTEETQSADPNEERPSGDELESTSNAQAGDEPESTNAQDDDEPESTSKAQDWDQSGFTSDTQDDEAESTSRLSGSTEERFSDWKETTSQNATQSTNSASPTVAAG